MKKLLIIILSIISYSCVRTNPNGGLYVPFPTGKRDYPIDVFFKNQQPTKSYNTIGKVFINEDMDDVTNQTVNGRMVKRGNNEENKQLLMARLTIKAQEMGADAIMDVNYRLITDLNGTSYEVSGVAIRYVR
jgi:uncharacterized protein YbjQ (UPF0145 family)